MAKQTEEEKNLLELFRSTDETNIELALQMYKGLRQAGEKLKSVKKFLSVFDGKLDNILTYNQNRKEAFNFINKIENNNFDSKYIGYFNYALEFRPANNYAKKHYEFTFSINNFTPKIADFFVDEVREFFKHAVHFEHNARCDLIHEMVVFKFIIYFKLR